MWASTDGTYCCCAWKSGWLLQLLAVWIVRFAVFTIETDTCSHGTSSFSLWWLMVAKWLMDKLQSAFLYSLDSLTLVFSSNTVIVLQFHPHIPGATWNLQTIIQMNLDQLLSLTDMTSSVSSGDTWCETPVPLTLGFTCCSDFTSFFFASISNLFEGRDMLLFEKHSHWGGLSECVADNQCLETDWFDE